jgi:hypothetical protein
MVADVVEAVTEVVKVVVANITEEVAVVVEVITEMDRWCCRQLQRW